MAEMSLCSTKTFEPNLCEATKSATRVLSLGIGVTILSPDPSDLESEGLSQRWEPFTRLGDLAPATPAIWTEKNQEIVSIRNVDICTKQFVLETS